MDFQILNGQKYLKKVIHDLISLVHTGIMSEGVGLFFQMTFTTSLMEEPIYVLL